MACTSWSLASPVSLGVSFPVSLGGSQLNTDAFGVGVGNTQGGLGCS